MRRSIFLKYVLVFLLGISKVLYQRNPTVILVSTVGRHPFFFKNDDRPES